MASEEAAKREKRNASRRRRYAEKKKRPANKSALQAQLENQQRNLYMCLLEKRIDPFVGMDD